MIRAIYLASAMLGLAYSRVVNAGKVEDRSDHAEAICKEGKR